MSSASMLELNSSMDTDSDMDTDPTADTSLPAQRFTDEEILDASESLDWMEPPPETAENAALELSAMRRRQITALGAYKAAGTLTSAAKAAGVSMATLRRWRSEDPWFKQMFQEAEQMYGDVIHAEFHRRAIEGEDVPIIGKVMNEHQVLEDHVIGFKKVRSDRLLQSLGRFHDPRWRENYTPPPEEDDNVPDQIPIIDRMASRLSDMADRMVIDVTPDPDPEDNGPEEDEE